MTTQKDNNKRNKEQVQEFRGQILSWYDEHKRHLPWRALPGQQADPYKVWLSEIMLQQTTVGAVIPYFTKFTQKWPDVKALAGAGRDDVMAAWAGLGYYARARNLHACAQIVANDYKGVFPADQNELRTLPGVGEYTSAAVASIAFGKPAIVVDGNVERVMARYFAVEDLLPGAKKALKVLAGQLSEGQTERPGDYAQGLMDLGATVCTPQSPKCGLCPVSRNCQGFRKGIAQDLPRRKKKAAQPQKVGFVYWIEDAKGRVLLHRRPSKAMLGGMVGLPTSEWVKKSNKAELEHLDILVDILGQLGFEEKTQSVNHSFTHFDLQLTVQKAQLGRAFEPDNEYFWQGKETLDDIGFPTLFGKAYKLMR